MTFLKEHGKMPFVEKVEAENSDVCHVDGDDDDMSTKSLPIVPLSTDDVSKSRVSPELSSIDTLSPFAHQIVWDRAQLLSLNSEVLQSLLTAHGFVYVGNTITFIDSDGTKVFRSDEEAVSFAADHIQLHGKLPSSLTKEFQTTPLNQETNSKFLETPRFHPMEENFIEIFECYNFSGPTLSFEFVVVPFLYEVIGQRHKDISSLSKIDQSCWVQCVRDARKILQLRNIIRMDGDTIHIVDINVTTEIFLNFCNSSIPYTLIEVFAIPVLIAFNCYHNSGIVDKTKLSFNYLNGPNQVLVFELEGLSNDIDENFVIRSDHRLNVLYIPKQILNFTRPVKSCLNSTIDLITPIKSKSMVAKLEGDFWCLTRAFKCELTSYYRKCFI
jgi:hypothetical protein